MQRPFPLPMSIYENIAYGLKIKGIRNKKVIAEKLKSICEVALWDEVKDRLKTSAQRLSIGQQQRLCLHADLPLNPKLFLPMNQHPHSILFRAVCVIEEEFLRLKDDYTIILVTHILRQAKRLADFCCVYVLW